MVDEKCPEMLNIALIPSSIIGSVLMAKGWPMRKVFAVDVRDLAF